MGDKPNAGYESGKWNTTPNTTTAITADTTYTYAYAKKDTSTSTQSTTQTQTTGSTSTSSEETVTSPPPVSGSQGPITIAKVPSSVKAKVKKNKVTVTWKKINKKNKAGKNLYKQVKGIRVQVATDQGFTNIVKDRGLGKKKTKVTLKLQKKTTYYIRVRYEGSDGVSNWSKVKRVKTK